MAGVESPFITANLTADVPAAMQNSILGKRNKSKVETQVDGQKIKLDEDAQTGLFTNTPDPVMKILDSFKKKIPPPIEDPPPDPPKPPPESEVRKANFDLFMGNATVVPFTADDASTLDKNTGFISWVSEWNVWGNEDFDDLQEVMLVATWGDVTLLNKLEHAPYPVTISAAAKIVDSFSGLIRPRNRPVSKIYKKDKKKPDSTDTISPMLFPGITFNFEIHGTSGLQLGDVIKISDLPKKYEKTMLQITEINHQLSGMLWITSVKAEMRQVG